MAETQQQTSAQRSAAVAAAVAGGAAALVGAVGVLGRAAGVSAATAFVSASPTILLWVAIALLLEGAAVPALVFASRSRATRALAGAIGALGLAAALLSFAAQLAAAPIGPERLAPLLRVPVTVGFDPRPAHPMVVLGVASASAALILLALGRGRAAAGALGLVPVLAGLVALLGYLYRAPLFVGGELRPVALPAAIGLVALGTGVIAAAGPSAWPLQAMIGPSVKALLFRWFLPFVVGAVLVSDLTTADLFGALSPAVASALGALATVGATAAATYYLARVIGGRLDRAEQGLLRTSRLYDVLSQTNQLIIRVEDEQALFEQACRIAIERGGLAMAWVGVVDASHFVKPVAWWGEVGSYLDGLRISIDDVPEGRGPTGTALRERRPFVCRDIAADPQMAPWRGRARAMGYRSSAAFPLFTLDAVTGVYSLYARDEGWFTDEQVKLLTELSSDISFALGNFEKERRRLEAEARLATSDMRFRALIDNSSDMITLIDPDGTVRYQSPSVRRLLGYEPDERVGRSVFEMMHPEDAPRTAERLRAAVTGNASTETVLTRLRHRDGSWRTVETVGTNMLAVPGIQGIVLNSRDVTDRERLEAQLRQAQKMEAVGQLAGGIAHDFNNLLTVVLANAGLVTAALPDRPDIAEELRDLQEAARRGQAMVRNLMGFSRQGGVQSEPVDLGALVGHLTETLRRVLPESVEVGFHADEGMPPVLADPGAVEQMLLNLATNARDAMPRGGLLRIAVVREEVRRGASQPAWLLPGRYLCVTASDTGSGMDAETLGRVFEPFFTTKPAGKGTGLGMPMVYGLMKQHKGYVTVDSVLGRGTTVRLLFPETPAVTVPVAADAARRSARARGGSETVLVVEDEEALRRAARRILEREGYRVLVAADGQEALQILTERPGCVDLVFTDLIMPKLGGRELFERVQALGPMRFLVASGYAGRDVRENHGLPGHVPFINKPWTLEELVTRVRETVDSPLAMHAGVSGGGGA